MYIYGRCTCGRCRPMGNEQESVCCREVPKVAAHVPKGVAYYALMEDRPSLVDAPDIHTYRYTAYRQFLRWIWVWLGRRNRKVLPSSVVSEMRNAFPSEWYAGFKYPV
ncbi:uncharacterized protein LOC142791126 [Rhipicephalus microplus]|uniref:uncharacterized protein LOC142791126 n=1 Tax=Rhipicephalus microplus TaxID=6941 RepID=UPI003F6C7F14